MSIIVIARNICRGNNINDVRVKRSKSDCACTKTIETLGPAKHEHVALLRGMRVF